MSRMSLVNAIINFRAHNTFYAVFYLHIRQLLRYHTLFRLRCIVLAAQKHASETQDNLIACRPCKPFLAKGYFLLFFFSLDVSSRKMFHNKDNIFTVQTRLCAICVLLFTNEFCVKLFAEFSFYRNNFKSRPI